MERALRRPTIAIAALATTGSLALAPIAALPSEHALSPLPATVSSQAVQLTDAWSDLATGTLASLVHLGKLASGTDSSFPLPSPTIPLAPVATQLVLNQLIYVAQLFTGQGGQIPGEIINHLGQVGALVSQSISALSGVIPQQLLTPFISLQQSIEFVANSTNKLSGLIQAPAIFLNGVINGDAGLLGPYGPIGVSLIIRNLLTAAIYTPLPTIVLPFKKAGGAASTPKPTTVTAKVAAPSGVAGSARSKPKAPANSSRKAAAAKAGTGKPGQGHGKRG